MGHMVLAHQNLATVVVDQPWPELETVVGEVEVLPASKLSIIVKRI
ncbi:hypothetical protein ACVWZX_004328 [Deinococcus sp. UYEF24]